MQLKEMCSFSYPENILLGSEEARNWESCRTFTGGEIGRDRFVRTDLAYVPWRTATVYNSFMLCEACRAVSVNHFGHFFDSYQAESLDTYRLPAYRPGDGLSVLFSCQKEFPRIYYGGSF